MEWCVGAFINKGAVWVRLSRSHRRGHHDAGGPYLALDVAVLVQPPVDEVLVVGDGHVRGHGEPAHPSHLGADVVIDVLPQHRVVFLMDTDGVRLTLAVVQHRIEVADLAKTVAAKLQRSGHEAKAPFADVEGGAPVVVHGGVAVGHDHLSKRYPVCHRAFPLAIAVSDGVKSHPLAVVEADAQRPVLPSQQVAVERERRSVGLLDVQRLEWLTP